MLRYQYRTASEELCFDAQSILTNSGWSPLWHPQLFITHALAIYAFIGYAMSSAGQTWGLIHVDPGIARYIFICIHHDVV
ncbi:hypothetical protein OPV22_011962 [Ensete ventricosum]|uniref:Uncharacterized protein n=1 Tax=Ensete ventricosum TaxID=4639 RepID=A0AAV8R1H8_ENSVE|nr:hypothetical protein OPV22_034804 [Ensete ventricosum]KAJ8490241.1 hypothetical protein OPV22_011962 [Ensete ventricosum]